MRFLKKVNQNPRRSRPILIKPITNHKVKARKFRKVSFRLQRVLKILLGIVSASLLIGLVYLLVRLIYSPQFVVSRYEFLGNKSISDQDLQLVVKPLTEQSIFLLNSSKLEQSLKDQYVFFKTVKIQKVWPDKLWVNINEREPKLIFINLNGAYLIDEDARVINILSTSKINFNTQELEIIRGLGDPQADYVKQRLKADYLAAKAQSKAVDYPKFNFVKTELSIKQAALTAIQNDLYAKASQLLEQHSNSIDDNSFASFPKVYSYDNSPHGLYSFIDKSLLDLTVEVENFFSRRKKERVIKVIWESNFLINCKLKNGKTAIFGTQKDVSIQLEDYLLVTAQLKREGKNFSQIDLSSKKISVR